MSNLIIQLCLTLLLSVSLPSYSLAETARSQPQTQQGTQEDTDGEAIESSEETEQPASTAEYESEDLLSTEVEGLDSLNLAPSAIETPYQGGHRRIQLERSVFRRATPIVYASNGRRDPFRALVVDEKKEGEIVTDLLRVEGAVLTGVVWAEGEFLAMVKDKDGTNFFLREGDPVYSGRVTAVTQTQMVIDVSEFGDYRQVILKVQVTAKPKG